MTLLSNLLLLASFIYSANAYTLKTQYDASNFFSTDNFNFVNNWDTYNHGLTQYLSLENATNAGIAKITADNKVYLGVDNTGKLTSTTPGPGNGRKSIRLEGVQTIDNGLLIADFDHLPSGACGPWTAFWLVHDSATYSEIDIIENINLATTNTGNLYTSVTCQMQNVGSTGATYGNNCQIGQSGCHVEGPEGSFGKAVNDHQGGFWATQIESDGVKMWYFPRGTEPADIKGSSPDPTKWGKPLMNYGVVNCDMKSVFNKMQIVINIVMCGNWPDFGWSACSRSTGYSTCEAYVANHPEAFKDTYYLINSIKHFQMNVQSSSSALTTLATMTLKSSSSSLSVSTSLSSTTSTPAPTPTLTLTTTTTPATITTPTTAPATATATATAATTAATTTPSSPSTASNVALPAVPSAAPPAAPPASSNAISVDSKPVQKTTPDATCGGTTGNTCLGGQWGNCCSQYGWCGSAAPYCGDGCQAEFGSCMNMS